MKWTRDNTKLKVERNSMLFYVPAPVLFCYLARENNIISNELMKGKKSRKTEWNEKKKKYYCVICI